MVCNINIHTWIEQTPIHLKSKTGWVHIPSIGQYSQPHSNKDSRQGDVICAVSGCRKVEQLQGWEMDNNIVIALLSIVQSLTYMWTLRFQ